MENNEIVTYGMLVFATTLVSAAFLAAWRIANIRKVDREDTSHEIDGKIDALRKEVQSLEDKTDANHDQLHSRVNRSVEDIGETKVRVALLHGFVKGKLGDVD